MSIVSRGTAGTLESGDIFIEIEDSGQPGVEIDLESTVKNLYGDQICQVIEQAAQELGLSGIRISATDKGALDCTIRSRVTAAGLRALGTSDYAWKTN